MRSSMYSLAQILRKHVDETQAYVSYYNSYYIYINNTIYEIILAERSQDAAAVV